MNMSHWIGYPSKAYHLEIRSMMFIHDTLKVLFTNHNIFQVEITRKVTEQSENIV